MTKKPKIVAPRVSNKGGYQVQDVWFHKAKAAGYRARSAFKLLQLDEETKIIRPGMIALDLGCAPGSWLQVLSKIIGEKGKILGIDLQEVEKFSQKNVTTMVGDMTAPDTHKKILEYLRGLSEEKNTQAQELEESGVWGINETKKVKNQYFQIITSDVAPRTTGRNDDDQYHSAMLCLEVIKVAEKFLAPGGSLVMKIFVGRDLAQVMKKSKLLFKKVQCIKPPACRDRSFEEYVVCQGFIRNR